MTKNIMAQSATMTTMKAYVYDRYGGPEVVHLADVPKPVPGDHEVLVRIRATSVSTGDWRVRTLSMPRGFGPVARLAIGVRGPRKRILGTELAGVVEAVGGKVTRFKPGDEVFAFPGGQMGCHAQYRTVAEDGPIAHKPERLSFEEAASLSFGGMTALHFLRKAELRAGERVLVIGASGSVGSSLLQLAKQQGAVVTAVTSTSNMELVASLGADHVIDYTKERSTENGERYDVIADAVGSTDFASCKDSLRDGGRFLGIAGGMPDMLAAARTSFGGSKKAIAGPAEERPSDMRTLAELAQSGALRPVIDRRYPFAQMRDAHAYVETGRKRGSVVVVVDA